VKRSWFLAFGCLFLVVTAITTIVVCRREPKPVVVDEAFRMEVEAEIREVLSEYTEALRLRDVERIADLIVYPFDMGAGYQISAWKGFVSRMSHDFRKYVVQVDQLSHEIVAMDVQPDIVVASVSEKGHYVGDYREKIALDSELEMTFRPVDGGWKIAGIHSDSWVSLTFRRRADSGRVYGW